MRAALRFLSLLSGSVACASAPFGLRNTDGGRLPLPVYPPNLFASGVEGVSAITVVWRDDGRVDTARTYRRHETHPEFTREVLAAVGHWKATRRTGGTTHVEAIFALTTGLCARRDTAMPPASRAKKRAQGDTLRIVVESESCRPYRPPVATAGKR
jgi:hypothetical protein